MQAFPLWLIWALAGHLANGVAFVIDKTLLRQSFKHPATYAVIIGLMGALAAAVLPFGVRVPAAPGLFWIVVSGSTFILSLWVFFAALARGEASRVVPIIGSLIPILTLIGTSIFLGERLNQSQFIGFGLLVAATVMLSGGSAKSRLTVQTIWISILAAVIFAASSVTAKLAYMHEGFITTFAISRFSGVIAALFILALDGGSFKEVSRIFFPQAVKKDARRASGPSAAPRHSRAPMAVLLVLAAQSLGALGFVGVQYATSLGSAALVNALQAVQYALLVGVAFALKKRAPDLLGEDLTAATVARKSIAIAVAGIGMWLVV